jgi:ABC-type multidrug transport system permease subunit
MAYPYSYPLSENLTNSSGGLIYLIVYLNDVTNFWFINFLLIAIYIILASGFYYAKGDVLGGFAVAGFVTGVISLIFWIAGIVPDGTFAITIGVAIISFIALFIGHND